MCKKVKSLEEFCDGDITVILKIVIRSVIYGGVCLGDCRSDGTMMIDDSFRMVAGMGIIAMCTIENGVLLGLILVFFTIDFLVLGLVIIEAIGMAVAVGVAVIAGEAVAIGITVIAGITREAMRIVADATMDDGILLGLVVLSTFISPVVEARAVETIGTLVIAGMGVLA